MNAPTHLNFEDDALDAFDKETEIINNYISKRESKLMLKQAAGGGKLITTNKLTQIPGNKKILTTGISQLFKKNLTFLQKYNG